MRAEIHRHWMATPTREDGLRAAAYDVVVPVDDCLEGSMSRITILKASTGLSFRAFPDATWTTRLSQGLERYCQWVEHEKACQDQMLAWLHDHCPETRPVRDWPMFWCHVDALASMETVYLEVQDTDVARIRRAAARRHRIRTAGGAVKKTDRVTQPFR